MNETVTQSPEELVQEESIELLTVGIISNETVGDAPATFEFEANLTGGTEPYTYVWNFGDDSQESDKQTVSHTFDEAGNYTVTLTATDSDGETASDTLEVTVNEPTTDALTSKIISNETVGDAPATFEFKADIAGGTEPYTYNWNFGDDSQESDKQTVSHTFDEAGSYNVTLAASDTDNQNAR